jgi:hypothetical protein
MKPDIRLVGVPSESVDDIWTEVKPMLQKGINHGDGELDIDDILKFVLDKTMQLWVVYNYSEEVIIMAGVTQIIIYPKCKVCRAVVLGGDGLDRWLEHVSGIEKWALSKGCDKMEAYGRRGLAKKMEDIGYTNKYVVIRKDLCHSQTI